MILGVIAGYVLLFLLMILGEAMGYNSMDHGITVYYIWLGISQVYAIGLLLFTLKKSRTVQQVFLLPALAFPILEHWRAQQPFPFLHHRFISPRWGFSFHSLFIIWLLRENMREEQRTQLPHPWKRKWLLQSKGADRQSDKMLQSWKIIRGNEKRNQSC